MVTKKEMMLNRVKASVKGLRRGTFVSDSLPSRKFSELEKVIQEIPDGATVMVGGFGIPGTPFELLKKLANSGAKSLTIIKNDANEAGSGIDWLLQNGQVKKLIASHIGLNKNAVSLMNSGDIEVEFVPQGILSERVRAAGVGLKAIATDIGLHTELTSEKQHLVFQGEKVLLEPALHADFALIHAAKADPLGNLQFDATARNFNPLMTMAAGKTLVEVEEVVELGTIDPECVHLPGVFVDHLIPLGTLSKEYDVKR